MATTTLDFSTPHVLRNAREYRAAVGEVEQLLDAEPKKGTRDYERLEFLSVLIQAYEEKHVEKLRDPTPREIVDFMLEQKGTTRADLATPWAGGAESPTSSAVCAHCQPVRSKSSASCLAFQRTCFCPSQLEAP
jgi:antitoxin component HigA of HigAB toxin-antitoxin module